MKLKYRILDRPWEWRFRRLTVNPLPKGSTDYPDGARGGWIFLYGCFLVRWAGW